ncbi:hypothetical protein CYY_003946 [Polysphondylium violaceum]|uniref:Importin N-terminal domain-containing protein n=1 Tax=Polysphondylium violaceum TaxID=133409 RepID=A0A8J4V0S5_9MYCE|nr:hypothetical protein CYY_003946 [Polysphondylium violaceum]
MEIPPDLINTLVGLASGNNDLIKQSENVFKKFKTESPDVLVRSLILMMKIADDQPLLKEYAPVLLRQLIHPNAQESVWEKLSLETKVYLKDQLIERLQLETKPSILHKIVTLVSTVASDLIEKGIWPDLLQFLIAGTTSQIEHLRESSFSILGTVILDLSQMITPQTYPTFVQVIENGLKDPSLKVRIAALGAINSFIEIDADNSVQFKKLIPNMISTITSALEVSEEKSAQNSILSFILIVEANSNWVKDHFPLIYQTFFEIMISPDFEEETRHFCVEFFITVAENKPSLIKQPQYLAPITQKLLEWVTTVEDVNLGEWDKSEGENDPEELPDYSVALDALERLSFYVPKNLTDQVFPILNSLLQSPKWNQRYAALIVLTMIADGCKKSLGPHLKSILEKILGLANDEHPRVRYALFYCLCQLSIDFRSKIQKNADHLIPLALRRLGEEKSRRVVVCICKFLTEFLDDIKSEIAIKFKDQFFGTLEPLVTSQDIIISQDALNTFSSVIDGIGAEFTPYYDRFMPFLFNIISKNGKEYATLRGRAIETISLIGLAVKKEKFAPYCQQLMLHLKDQPKFANDDPQTDFFLRAYTRFCQCLGEDFVPFLPIVMAPLVDALTNEISISTEQFSTDFVQDSIASDSTMAAENKALALHLLSIYAAELKRHLAPYAERLFQETLKLINYKYNEEIKNNAVEFLPQITKILKSDCEAKGDNSFGPIKIVFEHTIQHLIKSLEQEESIDSISIKLKALCEMVDIVTSNVTHYLPEFFSVINETLQTLVESDKVYTENLDEEDDDQQESYVKDSLDEGFNNIAILAGDICIHAKEQAVGLMSNIIPTIISLIEGSRAEIKSSMICIFDDIIESCGEPGFSLFPHIIPPIMASCLPNPANSSDVLQSAAFGLGVAAQYGKEHFASFAFESIKVLSALILRPDAKSEDNITSTENAISALGKIISHLPHHLNQYLPELVSQYIMQLPIQDEGEYGSSINSLFLLMTNPESSKVIFGSGDLFIKSLVSLAEAHKKKVVTAEFHAAIKQLFSDKTPQLQEVFLHLNPNERENVKELLN